MIGSPPGTAGLTGSAVRSLSNRCLDLEEDCLFGRAGVTCDDNTGPMSEMKVTELYQCILNNYPPKWRRIAKDIPSLSSPIRTRENTIYLWGIHLTDVLFEILLPFEKGFTVNTVKFR